MGVGKEDKEGVRKEEREGVGRRIGRGWERE